MCGYTKPTYQNTKTFNNAQISINDFVFKADISLDFWSGGHFGRKIVLKLSNTPQNFKDDFAKYLEIFTDEEGLFIKHVELEILSEESFKCYGAFIYEDIKSFVDSLEYDFTQIHNR